MTYIDYLENFDRIASVSYIPPKAQFLYMKILMRFYLGGWPDHISVSNQTMMAYVMDPSEKSFIISRNYLVKSGFIEYKKGTKHDPSEYRLLDISNISVVDYKPHDYVSDVQLGRNSKEYHTWRSKVLDRDNYKCQICGKTKGILDSHHKKSWSEYPDLRFVVDNGITLCADCHKAVHRGEVLC